MIQTALLYQFKHHKTNVFIILNLFILFQINSSFAQSHNVTEVDRERICISKGWKFFKYADGEKTDNLIYDVRPEVKENIDGRPADAKPTEASKIEASQSTLKQWILPTGNSFVSSFKKKHIRPEGNPGENFPFVQNNFDDKNWESINLPHDW